MRFYAVNLVRHGPEFEGAQSKNRVDDHKPLALAKRRQNGDRCGRFALAARFFAGSRALRPVGKNKRLTKSKKGGKKKTCVPSPRRRRGRSPPV